MSPRPTVAFRPGTRYEEISSFEPPQGQGIWNFLGWRRVEIDPGYAVLEWEPTTDHSFPAGDDWIVHGGMVTALLDTAMGNATWTLLNSDEVFLTADLRSEFYRPTHPGPVRATGWVVHKTRRVTFAAAEIHDANGNLLSSGRATNITLEASDRGRRGPANPDRG